MRKKNLDGYKEQVKIAKKILKKPLVQEIRQTNYMKMVVWGAIFAAIAGVTTITIIKRRNG